MPDQFRKSPFSLALSTAVLAALSSSSGWAQQGADTLEEVLVTAQRRAEASIDVPISLTTLSQDQLTTANVNQLADTARLTPGLRFDSQGPAVQPTIRGVGTAVTTSGGGPNVGIYVDGFFQANTYVANFDLLNVENIQVLKGPQGTLFGRNTTGGAILVTTADPSFEPSGSISASYGRFDTQKVQGYATFGLSENVAMDIEGLYRTSDGYVTNNFNGDDEVASYENHSIRTGLLIDVSPDVRVVLRYIHAEVDDPNSQLVNAYVDGGNARFFDPVSAGGQAFYGTNSSAGQPLVYFYAPASTYETDPGEITTSERVSFNSESDSFQARVEVDLGFADLTSFTQYREDDSPYYGDLDATALPFFNLFVGVEDETISQEFLLTSKSDSELQWTAGFNYFSVEDTWDVGASFGGAPFMPFGGSSTTTTSYAAFIDTTYQFADRWYLTAGLRYSNDEVSDAYFKTNFSTMFYEGPDGNPIFIDPISTPPGSKIGVDDLDNDSVTPRLVLRYEPTDFSSVYVSYTQGYKSGILNVGGTSQKPVEPEEIEAYEVGYKFDNRKFSLDLAAYFYDYTDLQFSSFQNGAAQIRNAKSSEIYGLEAQSRYQLNEKFSIYGGVAWTHAEYKDFDNAPYYSYCDPTAAVGTAIGCVPTALGGFGPGALTQVTADASGNEMQRSPEWTGNIGASYDVNNVAGGVLTFSGNLYYSSSFYFDAAEQFEQDSYEVLSLRAQWVDAEGRYEIALYGDNVTDERYQTQVLFNTLGIGSVWNSPVTYGVSATARF